MKFASAGNLTALFDYLRMRGVPPSDVADRAALAFITGAARSERIPARLPIEILERCAVRLGEPLFGLKFAQQLDAKSFGPISLFWRYAPTLRYSNRFTSRILHIHYEGMAISLTVDGEEAGFVHAMDFELRRDARQFVEANMSFALRGCRWVLGPGWSPLRIAFAHQPACDPERYKTILNAPVRFGAMDDAVMVRKSDLDRQAPGHDPDLLEFVERSLLAAAEREPLGFRERLERTVDDLLARQQPQLPAVAAAMGLSVRTLQRRLASEGCSFQALLCERRQRVIEASLLGERRPVLSQLAERTGYSEASAVSRFLRARSPHLRRPHATRSGGAVGGDQANLPDTSPTAGDTEA